MKRALNIPSADKEVWNVITHTLTNSSAIKDRFTSSTLLGSGLSSKQIVNYKTQCNNSLENFVMQKEQIEKALVKVEAANAMGEYVSNEVYSGTKKELITQYNNIKVKIESVSGELQQLGNQQEWLNWIDDFGNQLNTANKLTDPEKKRIINSVVKDILVDYDQEEKLHHLRINFRLPVMSSVEGILRANDVVLKRGNNSTKMVQTIENTGAPERPRSALFHSYRFC